MQFSYHGVPLKTWKQVTPCKRLGKKSWVCIVACVQPQDLYRDGDAVSVSFCQRDTRTMQAMPNKTLYRYSPAMYTRRFLQETIFLRSPSCLAVSVVYCLTVGQKCLVQNSCPQKNLWHKKPPIPDEERGRVAIRACPASAFPRRRLCAEARQECLCAVDNGARTGRSQYSGLPGAGAVRICRSLRDRRAVPRGSSCP